MPGADPGGGGVVTPPLLSTTNFFFNKHFNYSQKKKILWTLIFYAMYLNLMFRAPLYTAVVDPPPPPPAKNPGSAPVCHFAIRAKDVRVYGGLWLGECGKGGGASVKRLTSRWSVPERVVEK